jgi:hypothetical protein
MVQAWPRPGSSMTTGPKQLGGRPLPGVSAAGVPLDGGGLHVANVGLQQLGVVGREARVVDEFGQQDRVAGPVDALLLRVVQEDVVDAPGQQVSFPRFGRMAMASLALATDWSSGRVATSDDLGDLGFVVTGLFVDAPVAPSEPFLRRLFAMLALYCDCVNSQRKESRRRRRALRV